MYDHETFLSPLTWRYGSDEMRRIWSEEYKRLLWRRIWVALAGAQSEVGLVSSRAGCRPGGPRSRCGPGPYVRDRG